MSYKGRTILVTGGTGFIGGRLAERLAVEERARVRVLVRDWRKASWVSRAPVELVPGDLGDPESLARAMEGCDALFHCAAIGGAGALDDAIAVNVRGTRNVLEAARQAKARRFVHVSSIAVHGPSAPDNADESAPFARTGSPYGDSKIAAEEAVWQFHREHGLPVSVVRPTFVWGPCSPYFTVEPIRRMKSGRWFLVDGGRGTCHAVYIDNLVDALLLAGARQEAVGEAFLVTDGQACTWAEFFGHYARMVGRKRLPSVARWSPLMHGLRPAVGALDGLIVHANRVEARGPARIPVRATQLGLRVGRYALARYSPYTAWDVAKYARRGGLNTAKAHDVLGYTPRYSLEEGMRLTEAWLRDQGYLP